MQMKLRRKRVLLLLLSILLMVCTFTFMPTLETTSSATYVIPYVDSFHTTNSSSLISPRILFNQPQGPGERGQGVKLTENDVPAGPEREFFQKLYDKYKYNAYLSDQISLHRSISSDVNDPRCLAKRYDQPLPTASVVVPFRDERRSMLLRTVHSVLDRSPPHLLKEVILVDDGSENDDLKASLDVYVALLDKVKLIRLPSSQGLMIARNTGVRAASGDVIIVFDAHVETAPGWMEPLLERIRQRPKALVFPSMDVVRQDDLAFQAGRLQGVGIVPAFNFYLDQAIMPPKESARLAQSDPTEPVKAPAIQGWAFAMNRTFFLQLGGFDEGMRVWGQEQLEISFKVWMCGGEVECIPCSRVGHVYKKSMVWNSISNIWEVTTRNALRVAAVWLDPPYRDLVLESVWNYTLDYGDVSERKKLRETNKCSTFQEYLDKISKFVDIYIPINQQAKGAVVSTRSGQCLTVAWGASQSKLAKCHYKGMDQYWELTSQGHIRHADYCFYKDGEHPKVVIKNCIFNQPDTWAYDQNSKIVHQGSKLCLDAASPSDSSLGLVDCSAATQWKWHRM